MKYTSSMFREQLRREASLSIEIFRSLSPRSSNDLIIFTGWSCAPLAVASGNIAVVKEILRAVKWNRKDLAPALCLAALDGWSEAADLLLASRANVNEPIPDSGTSNKPLFKYPNICHRRRCRNSCMVLSLVETRHLIVILIPRSKKK